MSTKTIKWILLGTGILLIILAFMVKGQDRSFFISWDYYFDTGSSDVTKLKIYEVNADTVVTKVMSDSINPSWTTHRFTIQDDNQLHYFTVTAVDSAGNESDFSNIAVLDLAKPIKVFGVKITN